MKRFPGKYFAISIFLICFLAGYAWSQNVPGGGTGTGANVTVTDKGTTVILNNGIVSVTITKSTATITSYTYKGMNLLAGGHGGGSFYWTWNMPNLGGPANAKYTLTADPATNGGNYAEVLLSSPWSGDTTTGAMDVNIYYSLTRGAQGYYVSAIVSHPATYPANPGGEWRCNTYIGSIFDWLSVDSTRNRLMATPADFTAASVVPGAPKEVVLLNTGIYKGEYECKYSYSADLGDMGVWGWTSTSQKVGIWMTVPSHEYYNGGPMKRELTGHNGHTLLNMLGGQHYGMGGDFQMPAGKAFQKTYGPFFIYANSYNGSASDPDVTVANTLWKDAQAQAAAEQSAWPYTWFNNPAYVQESGRGTASGVLVVSDNGTTVPAANCWIGLAPDDNGTDFQLQARTYQFWVKTDNSGNFKIPHILPGTYNLWAFGPATTGTFKQTNVTIAAGQILNLNTVTWAADRVAPTVWEIGTPDRDTKEFLNGHRVSFKQDTLPPYAIWGTFAKLPQEFPAGLTYTVGQSNVATGWNYAQPTIYDSATAAYDGSTWKVKFTLAKAPAAGSQASIYMAFAADDAGPVIVTVNGTNITTPTTGFFPANASDAMIRLGSHGAFSEQRITFASNLLKAGANEIDFNMRKGGSNGNFAMYDYLRLECSGLNVAPTATITPATTTTFCTGGSVVLNANTGTGYTYQWNKAGAPISGATAASYTATTSGAYTVAVTSGGLTTTSAATTVTVNAIPAAPTVTTPVTYCQNATASALTATGTALKWYTVASGGTSSTAAPTPFTTVAGTTSYYVSQTTNTCESPRATIAVTVNAIPTAPTATTPVTYCQGATASALTATGTALKWYTVATGGTNSTTTPTPSTTTTGTTSYYVSQTTNTCESPRATIAVTVNAIPAAPTVTTPITYCQNATASALTATGTALKWYIVATGGTSSATAPTPTTTTAATTSYYVSQTTNTCESPRATIAVTINATPTVPTVTTPVYHCQGSTVTALTATGAALKWYTVATGGTSSTTAPIPVTTTAGTTSYYVSQTTNTCESPRAIIAVTINAVPTASILATSSTTFCSGGSVVLNANTGTGLTYQWNNNTGAIVGATNSTYTASSAGSYTVKVTNSSNCSATSGGTTVTVDTPPTTSTAGSNQYITASTANLSANTPTTGTGSWSVVSGTANFSNSASATSSVSGLSTGANVLQWTISNGSCTPSNSTVTINVGTSPTTQTITGPSNVTSNETGVTYSVPDNAGSTYHWTLPAGATITSANTDSSSIMVSFGTNGGTVSVKETNPYGNATSTLPMSVGNAPTTQTISGQTDITSNETGVTYSVPDNAGSTYHWTLPAGATITAANADSSQITISFGSTGGTVSVKETNSFGNATSTKPVGISSTTAVIAGTSTATYEVRPNPFTDRTTIIVHSAATEPISLSVIDVQGVTCYSSSQYYTNQEFTLGSELTSDGVYFVQIAYGNKLKVIKLVKIK